MPRASSVSFIIPVYDGGGNLRGVTVELDSKLRSLDCLDYEVLAYYRKTIGEAFRSGVIDSSKKYLGIYSAYDQIDSRSLDSIIPALKEADVVVGFIANPEARSWLRRVYSWTNVVLANFFFGLNLKYYHFCFFRADLAKKVETSSSSHASMTETAVWLISSGATYVHVPIFLKPHDFSSKSGAFRITNLAKILSVYLRLFIQIRI